jgi:Lipopolysaccharide kinase (Kdo/WaaP) family
VLPRPQRLLPLCFHGLRRCPAASEEALLFSLGLSSRCEWRQALQGQVIEQSSGGIVTRFQPESGPAVFAKVYDLRAQPWEFFLRRGKAQIECQGYQILATIGIPTLKCRALGERRHFGRLLEAYIVTEDAQAISDLAKFAERQIDPLDFASRAKLVRELSLHLAAQLRLAHASNFYHRDLKWRNLLVRRQGDSYQLVWMDCPRQRSGFWGRLTATSSRILDLSSLARRGLRHLSLSQRWRFLRLYLGNQVPLAETKALFRAVQAHLAKRPPRLPGDKKSFYKV